jgi:hypothetical protein
MDPHLRWACGRLTVMRDAIHAERLVIEDDISNSENRWRIYTEDGSEWVDFWPHTGTFYQPQKKLRESESD